MKNNRLHIEYDPLTRIKNKLQSMRCNNIERAMDIVTKRFNTNAGMGGGFSNIIKATFRNNFGVVTELV